MGRDLTVYFDGLCEPNPGGLACWAWVATDGTQQITEGYGCFGQGPGMTNNRAEYEAAIRALGWMVKERGAFDRAELVGDSQLVIYQASGRWNCNAAHLRPLCDSVAGLVRNLEIDLRWVPREQNAEADALCQKVYQKTKGARAARRREYAAESKPRGAVRLTDPVTLYWALARWAISQGLLSEDRARTIARVGTRKAGYWARHLVDLCGVIACQTRPNDESMERGQVVEVAGRDLRR